MSKRLDRVINGPSWAEVVFGALLSFVLGVVIAAALLVLKPVVAVKELPKAADRQAGVIYYVEGSRFSARATQAVAKRKLFAEGQSVTVTEDEINSLVQPTPSPAAKPGETAATTAENTLATGTPNFRIRDGAMQIGVPVTVNVLGVSHKTIVQARGGFEKSGELFVFQPSELYLGSCPVQRLPFVAGYVRKQFLAAQIVPADVSLAWPKLTGVAIEGNELKLTMP